MVEPFLERVKKYRKAYRPSLVSYVSLFLICLLLLFLNKPKLALLAIFTVCLIQGALLGRKIKR
jgi:antibiotic biosynthesis monooxygenase (ABM) superfamily enzyme